VSGHGILELYIACAVAKLTEMKCA